MNQVKNLTEGLFEILLPGSFLLANIIVATFILSDTSPLEVPRVLVGPWRGGTNAAAAQANAPAGATNLTIVSSNQPVVPNMQVNAPSQPGPALDSAFLVALGLPLLGLAYIVGMVLRMIGVEKADQISRRFIFLVWLVQDILGWLLRLKPESGVPQSQSAATATTNSAGAGLSVGRWLPASLRTRLQAWWGDAYIRDSFYYARWMRKRYFWSSVPTTRKPVGDPTAEPADKQRGGLAAEAAEERSISWAAQDFFSQFWEPRCLDPKETEYYNYNNNFINFVKTLLWECHPQLAEQLRNAEAVSRFISGSFFALVLSAILAAADTCKLGVSGAAWRWWLLAAFTALFYLILAGGIAHYFHKLRIREATMIFEAAFACRGKLGELLDFKTFGVGVQRQSPNDCSPKSPESSHDA